MLLMEVIMLDRNSEPVFIAGGTGKTGRRVAERLTARGIAVRIGSRQAAPAFDWNDRATWADAVSGAGAAYITYYPDVTVPGAVETVESFIQLALEKDCHRLVFLSGRGEEEARRAEQVLIRSGAEWTVVRAAWFMQNFSESFFLDGIRAGEVVFPADKVVEPFVDADDIADIVAKALSEKGHTGEIYEVTGPRLMTFAEATSEIARATGRDIRYVPVDLDAYVATMRDLGVPDDEIQLLEYLIGDVLDGRNESMTDGVQRALGRAPRDFADYARDAAATGVWRT